MTRKWLIIRIIVSGFEIHLPLVVHELSPQTNNPTIRQDIYTLIEYHSRPWKSIRKTRLIR